jgi:hypothetical protein
MIVLVFFVILLNKWSAPATPLLHIFFTVLRAAFLHELWWTPTTIQELILVATFILLLGSPYRWLTLLFCTTTSELILILAVLPRPEVLRESKQIRMPQRKNNDE